MINQPNVKLGIVGVSRDCFPITLTQARVAAVMDEVKKAGLPEVYACPVTIENDVDTYKALDWAKENGINAVCMFLGNFGPEGPTTLFVQKFGGPAMVLAAKEEGKAHLKVWDNGKGVPYEELPFIFDKGFTGHGTDYRDSTGMGLYFVKKYAEKLSIRVKIDEASASDSGFGIELIL